MNSTPDISTKATEFPRKLLPLLRCSRDAGLLSISREDKSSATGLIDGTLRCTECSQEYSVENGVVCMMVNSLTPEAQLEIAHRKLEYEPMPDKFEKPVASYRTEYKDSIEIPPHLEELEPLNRCKVLEIGCGDGRFTMLMTQMGADILAVDFSTAALDKLAKRLLTGVAPTAYRLSPRRTAGAVPGSVGLVQADVTCFHVAPRSFDRALSATPLHSRDERMKMYRTIADALTDNGRYIGGVEHNDLCRRLLGLPVVRRYEPGGILIQHLDEETMRRESVPYFSQLRFRRIRPYIPFLERLPLKVKYKVFVPRVVSAVPVIKQLGEILLLHAEGPIRLPLEGVRRPGNFVVKTFYRWYRRKKGKEPTWDAGIPV